MTDVPADLQAAYEAAIYEIDVEGGRTLTFTMQDPGEDIGQLMRTQGAACGVLLTAYNPRSRKQSHADNTAAHRALLEEIARRRLVHFPSRGRDPKGDWPAEPGLFILDLDRGAATALARRLDQYAYIFVTPDAAPELVLAQ